MQRQDRLFKAHAAEGAPFEKRVAPRPSRRLRQRPQKGCGRHRFQPPATPMIEGTSRVRIAAASKMSSQPRGAHMTAETKFEPFNVNVRIKISALWTSMLFVFAYVDLFSLYRRDIRADLEAGEIGGFTINQSFLFGTTAYVVVPSLMVFCALVLQSRVSRIANIALGLVYALTVIAAAIGEWSYYILGSAIEVALLAAIVYYAWTWPKETPPTSATGREPRPHDIRPTVR
jgi:hypothetical protein